MTVEADLLSVDHVSEGDDAEENYDDREPDGERPGAEDCGHEWHRMSQSLVCQGVCKSLAFGRAPIFISEIGY